MAGGARNDPSQNNDSEMKMAVVAILAVGLVLFLWYLARGVIVKVLFGLAFVELWAIKLTVGLTTYGEGALSVVQGTFSGRYDAWEMPYTVLYTVKNGAGEKVVFPCIAIILAMAVWCVMKMAGNGFTAKLSMNDLAKLQALSWRTLTPGAMFKADTAPPEWDQAMRPTDWISHHKISCKPPEGLDKEGVKRVMVSHLGEVWRGNTPDLPIHIRALITIFALHHVHKTVKINGETMNCSLMLREDVSVAYATLQKGPVLDARIEALIKPFANEKKMNQAIEAVMHPDKHAYVNTALFAQLGTARKRRGVLAAAEFLWVKGVDRNLWYVLNNVGRRAFHTEGGGAVAHHDAERISGTALIEPHVDAAVNGVETYLKDQFIEDVELFLKSEKPDEWEV